MQTKILSENEGGRRVAVTGVERKDLKPPSDRLAAFLVRAGTRDTLSPVLLPDLEREVEREALELSD